MFYAHIPKDPASGLLPEPVLGHLQKVAEKAAAFGSLIRSKEQCELLGWWHDVGKWNPLFQDRLYNDKITVGHAYAGAYKLLSVFPRNQALAMAVAGHHRGLHNLSDLNAVLTTGSETESGKLLWEASRPNVELPEPDANAGKIPPWVKDARDYELWTRMLFSVVVDSDRLSAEAYERGPRSPAKIDIQLKLNQLEERIEKVSVGKTGTMAYLRKHIGDCCREAASLPPRIFSLTAPTGGGKTYAMMNFALRHLLKWNLRRIIVVIPYTSIIDQNAARYDEVFAPDTVLQHHSSADLPENARQAAENWDHPIIVTTNVQFFESIFSSRPGRCRRVHNIANSVILFDEIQTVPARLRIPVESVLHQLRESYGCTVVLSTATQPALNLKATEIVSNLMDTFAAAGFRTKYKRIPGQITWSDLASRIDQHHQVLAIVNERKHARELWSRVPHAIHLSSGMCPAHRRKRISRIDELLKTREMCRVISTQVVEAGVDLDFPVVYRALAGADSIAQANGRCNREGQLDCGQMFLFDPAEGQTWVKDLRNGIQVLNGMEKAGLLDWDDPGIFKEYFTRAYKSSDGGVEIENLRKKLRFEDVEKYFQWIPDGQIPVLCPFGEGAELIRTLEERPTRELMRKTQQFTVSIFRKQADELKKAGYIVPMWEVETGDPLYRAIPEAYDQQFGLI